MKFELEIKHDALVGLKKLSDADRRLAGYRLHSLQQDFSGDVKKLKGSKNEYRLRVGDVRVLFELEGKRIVVYAVGNRKNIYK